MRIVKTQKYYKLNENLNEVHDIVGDVPGLENYYFNYLSEDDASS